MWGAIHSGRRLRLIIFAWLFTSWARGSTLRRRRPAASGAAERPAHRGRARVVQQTMRVLLGTGARWYRCSELWAIGSRYNELAGAGATDAIRVAIAQQDFHLGDDGIFGFAFPQLLKLICPPKNGEKTNSVHQASKTQTWKTRNKLKIVALIFERAPAARSRFWNAVFMPNARGKIVPNENTSNDVLKLFTSI